MIKKNLGPVTAYALAVKNGFEGTESEWLESLKGTPEWSLVQNKPVEHESIGDTITWDGNEEGMITASFPAWVLVHQLSDEDVAALRENPDLLKQAKAVDRDGSERLFLETEGENDEAYVYDAESVTVTLVDNYDVRNLGRLVFPKKGIYFFKGQISNTPTGTIDVQTASFTVPGFDFHKEVLKPDYVPYAVMTKPQSLTEQQQMQARKNLDLPYTEGGIVEILPETTLEFINGNFTITTPPAEGLVVGNRYTVFWDGEEYPATAMDGAAAGAPAPILTNDGADLSTFEGVVFAIILSDSPLDAFGGAYGIAEGEFEGALTIAIYHNAETIHKLDNKYIDAEWMATTKEVKGEELLAEKKYNSVIATPNDLNTAGLAAGKKVLVICDDVEYECLVREYTVGGETGLIFGNGGAANGLGWDGGPEPFVISVANGEVMVIFPEAGHTLSVYAIAEVPEKLPEKFLPTAAAVDMTAYESEGKIVETYPDGSEVTTTIEFDASGNPVKITDSFGNVTEVAW